MRCSIAKTVRVVTIYATLAMIVEECKTKRVTAVYTQLAGNNYRHVVID